MPGSLTNEGEALALNLLLRNTGTMPTNIYIGLASNTAGSIDETATLASLTEVDDVGYSRQEVVFNAPILISGKQTVDNNAQLEFGPWDSDEDAGVTYVFICDAETGTSGTLLGILELTTPKSPLAGESLTSAEGNCTFAID